MYQPACTFFQRQMEHLTLTVNSVQGLVGNVFLPLTGGEVMSEPHSTCIWMQFLSPWPPDTLLQPHPFWMQLGPRLGS